MRWRVELVALVSSEAAFSAERRWFGFPLRSIQTSEERRPNQWVIQPGIHLHVLGA